jgi:Domain of unknown function (DUF4397)
MRLCLLVLGLCLLSGCGGSSSSGTGNLRFVQASPDAPQLNLLVDGNSVVTTLSYSNATGYFSVAAGSRHVQLVPVNGGSPILDTAVSVTSSGYETLIMTGPAASIHSMLLTDSGTTSTTGDQSVRVVEAAAAIAAADVYIVPAGTSIAGVSPAAASLVFDGNTGYQLVPTGAYQVLLTIPGTKNTFLDTGTLSMGATAGQNQTVVVLDGPSNGFTFTVLADQ